MRISNQKAFDLRIKLRDMGEEGAHLARVLGFALNINLATPTLG